MKEIEEKEGKGASKMLILAVIVGAFIWWAGYKIVRMFS